jgi:DNA-binding NarL/FixJ family response regulator
MCSELNSSSGAAGATGIFMRQLVQHNWLAVRVDDDIHSARLLRRTFAEFDSTLPKWLGGASRGQRLLADRFKAHRKDWPTLVIVDLKASSAATLDFIAAIKPMAQASGAMIVAMVPTLDRPVREALLSAGAAAVFLRQGELAPYRQEIADIVSFWARNQRLDAVGT